MAAYQTSHKIQEDLVSGQFGSRAAAYLSSAVHAQGRDLEPASPRWCAASRKQRFWISAVAQAMSAFTSRRMCARSLPTICLPKCWTSSGARQRSAA